MLTLWAYQQLIWTVQGPSHTASFIQIIQNKTISKKLEKNCTAELSEHGCVHDLKKIHLADEGIRAKGHPSNIFLIPGNISMIRNVSKIITDEGTSLHFKVLIWLLGKCPGQFQSFSCKFQRQYKVSCKS